MEPLRERVEDVFINGYSMSIADKVAAILRIIASVRVREQREAYISGTLRDRGVMSEDWMECIREEAEMIYADVKEATHA